MAKSIGALPKNGKVGGLSSLGQSTHSFYLEYNNMEFINSNATSTSYLAISSFMLSLLVQHCKPSLANTITTASQCPYLGCHLHKYLQCFHLYQGCWQYLWHCCWCQYVTITICSAKKIGLHHCMPHQYLQRSCQSKLPLLPPLGHNSLHHCCQTKIFITFTIAGTSTTIHGAITSVTTAGASTSSRILANIVLHMLGSTTEGLFPWLPTNQYCHASTQQPAAITICSSNMIPPLLLLVSAPQHCQCQNLRCHHQCLSSSTIIVGVCTSSTKKTCCL